MEISNWITIGSVMAVISGWFINSSLNRRNEISKERLKYRLDALQSIFDLLSKIRNSITNGGLSNSDDKYISDMLIEFQIFAEEDEIELCEKFRKARNDNKKEEFIKLWDELTELVRDKIRKELGMSQLSKPYE